MNFVFLSVRVLHVLGAAIWLGSAVFIAFLLMPVLQQSGEPGGRIMVGLERQGLTKLMASVSGFTVLSGLWLYWHFTGGFDPVLSASLAGRVFGAGGVCGLAAAIIGGSVVGRSAKQAAVITAELASMPDGAKKTARIAEVQRLRQRMITFGHLVIALLVIALALMAVGHYV